VNGLPANVCAVSDTSFYSDRQVFQTDTPQKQIFVGKLNGELWEAK
jgi:hypothetical protein